MVGEVSRQVSVIEPGRSLLACARREVSLRGSERPHPMPQDATSLAQELLAAYAARQLIAAPSSRDSAFDLSAAYAVESEIVRLRRADGHAPVGVKVGFANKAVWRALNSKRSSGRTCTTTRFTRQPATLDHYRLGEWSRRRSNLRSPSS